MSVASQLAEAQLLCWWTVATWRAVEATPFVLPAFRLRRRLATLFTYTFYLVCCALQ